MPHSITLSTIALLCALLAALPARAEMGPCKPDDHDGLICGEGAGAARVIVDTVSPNKRLALAWRSPTGTPTEDPDDNLELLVVRLADGAVLAKTETEYWATGERKVNRLIEAASWSPDSRLVVRTFHSRFSTDNFDLFVLGAKDELIGTLDLKKIVEPAVRAQLKRRVRNADNYTFSVSLDRKLTVGNDDVARVPVMMWIPKDGPEANFEVTLRIARAKLKPVARVTSIRPIPASR
jgi:hypothetical protein